MFNIRSASTRNYYLRRLRGFFNYINLLPDESITKRYDYLAKRDKEDSNWAFKNIVRFLQFQRERVEQGEIAGSNFKNFLKAVKLFGDVLKVSYGYLSSIKVNLLMLDENTVLQLILSFL